MRVGVEWIMSKIRIIRSLLKRRKKKEPAKEEPAKEEPKKSDEEDAWNCSEILSWVATNPQSIVALDTTTKNSYMGHSDPILPFLSRITPTHLKFRAQ